MKKIYIVDEYISSTKNGIGRYMQELSSALEVLNIDTSIIELNSESKNFEIKNEKVFNRFCIPQSSNYYNQNSFVLCCLLRLHILDSVENIFIVNHSPCKRLIEALHKYFPLSKIVFVIHDLSWTSPLLGNKALFKEIMENREKEDIKDKYGAVLDSIDIVKDFLNLCDSVICLSPSTEKLLTSYYDISQEKVVLLPNFLSDKKALVSEIDKKTIKEKYNVEINKIILSVGRLTTPKGSLPLINSLKKVLEKHPDALLVFAGTMPQSDEISKAYQQVCNRVIFLGHIPFEKLLEWYQIADIGVVPSYTEQCSYTGIEMLMSALPIVASDGFGVSDMFQNEINAVVAKIENYEDSSLYEGNLANAIIQILDSTSLQERLKKTSKNTYEEKYSLEKGLKRLDHFIHSM